jgi:short-subunit dehydrogenase involved in D-alanine esterification of teichoic acids
MSKHLIQAKPWSENVCSSLFYYPSHSHPVFHGLKFRTACHDLAVRHQRKACGVAVGVGEAAVNFKAGGFVGQRAIGIGQ